MKLLYILHKIYITFIRKWKSNEEWARYCGVKIGQGCMISGKDHWSTEPYLISIGDNCDITDGVKIHTHGGSRVVRNLHPDFDCFGKVTIGNRVYIGAGSHIMPGVTIGDNVLIAAGSIVTKSIPSGVVVGGNPAKYICTIEDYINRNIKYNLNTKNLDSKTKMNILCTLDESLFISKEELGLDI